MLWLHRVVLTVLLLPTMALAADLSERQARAVRAVVQAQLKAFAADDAERAFSYATPAIRAQFGDSAAFMGMVRAAYPMVVRPVAVSFFQPTAVDGVVWQTVQLRDRAGGFWLATYQLQLQARAGWRINGCAVVADTGKSTT
jgi:hypothetical protein